MQGEVFFLGTSFFGPMPHMRGLYGAGFSQGLRVSAWRFLMVPWELKRVGERQLLSTVEPLLTP